MTTPFDFTQYLMTSELAAGDHTHLVEITLSGEYQTVIETIFNPGFTGDLVFMDISTNIAIDGYHLYLSGEDPTTFDYRWQIRPYNLGQDWQTVLEQTGNVATGATQGIYRTYDKSLVYDFTSGESFSPTLFRLQIKSSSQAGEVIQVVFHSSYYSFGTTVVRGVGNF